MKKIVFSAIACMLLFMACTKKAEDKKANESKSETESLSNEVLHEEEEPVLEAFVPDPIPEILSYPENVALELEQETELLKTKDFTLSIYPTKIKSGRDSDSFECDIIITDSDSNKTLLDTCKILKISEWENLILCYDVLDEEHPLVTADINNNRITDYLFIIDGLYQDNIFAFEKKDGKYVSILKSEVQVSGGPEADDIAESIVFNSGKKHDEIIIDYLPYNKRTVLEFDKETFKYVPKNEPENKMRLYNPKETLEVKQSGTHEFAVCENRVYLKEKEDYYKVLFIGDPETWGAAFGDNNLRLKNVKTFDVDGSSFIVDLSFVNNEKKDQFYYIFRKDGELYINKTDEYYGIACDYAEELSIQSAVKDKGGITVSYNVLDSAKNVTDTKTVRITVDNLIS